MVFARSAFFGFRARRVLARVWINRKSGFHALGSEVK